MLLITLQQILLQINGELLMGSNVYLCDQQIKLMKKRLNSNTLLLITALFITSCGDMSEKVEGKINQLNDKTDKLDSLLNKELDKVNTLDSMINKEGDKVKKLDSLINKSSSKIDSIANSKLNPIKNIIN